MNSKEKILSCALQLFSKKGYDSVGIQEIVDLAGITKPTLYHYFGSKLGLLSELLRIKFEDYLTGITTVAEYKKDIKNNIINIVKFCFEYAYKEKDFYFMQLSMSFIPDGNEVFYEIQFYHKKLFKIINKLFENASNDHGNMKGRSSYYSVSFLGMLNSYIVHYLNENKQLDEQTIYKVVHHFMHGIFS